MREVLQSFSITADEETGALSYKVVEGNQTNVWSVYDDIPEEYKSAFLGIINRTGMVIRCTGQRSPFVADVLMETHN